MIPELTEMVKQAEQSAGLGNGGTCVVCFRQALIGNFCPREGGQLARIECACGGLLWFGSHNCGRCGAEVETYVANILSSYQEKEEL